MNRSIRWRRAVLSVTLALLGEAGHAATPAEPLPGGAFPQQLTRVAGRLLFAAADGDRGTALWRTDGTPAGTERIANLAPPFEYLVLLAPTSVGVALQTFDGSIRYARAHSGGVDFLFRPPGESPDASFGFRLGGKAHFLVTAGDSSEATLELWQTDGSSAGSRKLAEIARFRRIVGYDVRVAVVPNRRSAYFLPVNTDGEVGDIFDGLWVTDGTPAGTRRAVAEPCAPCSDVRVGDAIVGPGGRLFYVINDLGQRFAQLWVSDGTEAGTKRLLETPGPIDGGEIRSLARLGSRVIFSAADPAHGQELWISDGTAAGTRRLADLRAGELSSAPRSLTAIGDRLVFAANDGIHGREVWSSDGTAVGTRLASDVQPGPLPSSPGDFVALGPNLLFVASRAATGRELFRLPLSALGPP